MRQIFLSPEFQLYSPFFFVAVSILIVLVLLLVVGVGFLVVRAGEAKNEALSRELLEKFLYEVENGGDAVKQIDGGTMFKQALQGIVPQGASGNQQAQITLLTSIMQRQAGQATGLVQKMQRLALIQAASADMAVGQQMVETVDAHIGQAQGRFDSDAPVYEATALGNSAPVPDGSGEPLPTAGQSAEADAQEIEAPAQDAPQPAAPVQPEPPTDVPISDEPSADGPESAESPPSSDNVETAPSESDVVVGPEVGDAVEYAEVVDAVVAGAAEVPASVAEDAGDAAESAASPIIVPPETETPISENDAVMALLRKAGCVKHILSGSGLDPKTFVLQELPRPLFDRMLQTFEEKSTTTIGNTRVATTEDMQIFELLRQHAAERNGAKHP